MFELGSFEFALAECFFLLPLPLLLLLLPKKKATEQQAVLFMPTVPYLSEGLSQQQKPPYLLPLLAVIWLLLIIAGARPQWLAEPIALDRQGRDLMLAVDLSYSMSEEDMEYQGRWHNRLNAVKSVVSDFVRKREGDRIGLILFADHAYLQAPLTFDLKAVEQFLLDSEIGLVGRKTAIGESIALAIKRFVESEQEQRILILLTDGQNTAGEIEPLEAAKLAKKENIIIYTVGIGAHEVLRRSLFSTIRSNPSADLDEDTLKQVAEMTGGQYFRAANPQQLLEIYSKLDQLNPIDQEKEQFRPQTALFIYPLAIALVLLLVLFILRTRLIVR